MHPYSYKVHAMPAQTQLEAEHLVFCFLWAASLQVKRQVVQPPRSKRGLGLNNSGVMAHEVSASGVGR